MGKAQSGGPELCAVAPAHGGWLYYSGSVSPYDLENLCERAAALAGSSNEAVHLEITCDASVTSPELKELARKLKKLEKRGVFAHLHTQRSRSITGR